MVERLTAGPSLQAYDMGGARLALTLCATENREGAESDIKALEIMFNTLGFKNQVIRHPKASVSVSASPCKPRSLPVMTPELESLCLGPVRELGSAKSLGPAGSLSSSVVKHNSFRASLTRALLKDCPRERISDSSMDPVSQQCPHHRNPSARELPPHQPAPPALGIPALGTLFPQPRQPALPPPCIGSPCAPHSDFY